MGSTYGGYHMCGGWSVKISMEEAEKDQSARERFLRRQNNLEARKAEMLKFINYMHRAFDGTIAEKPAAVLIKTWESRNFNKNLTNANIMICNMLATLPSKECEKRWEEALISFCEDHNHSLNEFIL